MSRSEGQAISREAAMRATPVQVPPVRTEALDDGGRKITVAAPPHRWQRFFGSKSSVERSFELDAFGVQVYDACNGRRTVADIVRRFARTHDLNAAEAEMSVTRFLKTLVSRGLVAMGVSEDDGDGAE